MKTDGWVKFWQLVVSGKMLVRLMQEVHNNVASDHLGINKTPSRLRQRFYWFGISQDVQERCRTCMTCNAKKEPAEKGKHLYKSTE